MSPSNEPALFFTQANGVRLACFEWHAALRDQRPTLLLVHATGFHGRVWDAMLGHLFEQVPPCHVLALEQRGHGRSEAADFESWHDFGQDLKAFVQAQDLQGAVGVGHSMGGHALVQAAAALPQAFEQLLLVDAVLRPPAEYHQPPVPQSSLHPSAGRKKHFDSPQAMVERFATRLPYSLFDAQALRDYCEHGLRPALPGDFAAAALPAGDMGFVLACDPAFEGRVYPLARNDARIIGDIAALQQPVLVLRSRPQDPRIKPWDPIGSPTWPDLASAFAKGRDLQRPDKTHFLPMEDPALMARILAECLQPTLA